MKKLALYSLFALASFSSLAHAESVLSFGVDPTFPPFESKTANGNLVGFDIDLGNAICQHLKMKCVWVETAYDSIIPALDAKKFDAVLSAMSINEKRKAQVDFSDMLYNTPSFLVAKKGSNLQPTVDSLKGKTIGVAQGTTQEAYAKGVWQSKGIDVVSYQNQDFVNQDLISGRIDATLTDSATATAGFLNTQQGKDFAFSGKALTDTHYLGEGAAIALRKGDSDRVKMIDSALAQMHKDGTYQTLEKKYFTFDVYNKKP